MEGNQWTRVAAEDELVDGVPLAVEIGDEPILIIKRGDEVCGCGDECPHYGAPLHEGVAADGTVTCPWHTAKFDVCSGAMLAPPALDGLPTYDVKIEDGGVFVRKSHNGEFPEIAADDGRTFIIVGAGAAGSAAAETLRREGFGGTITMITPEQDTPYDRTLLSKGLLSGEAKPEWLPLRGDDFYRNARIDILKGKRVTDLNPDERTVTLHDGQTLKGDAVLIATGSQPRTLNVPGIDGEGCFSLRSAEDGRRVAAAADTAETAVVVGTSFIGMEAASSLRARDIDVHLVDQVSVPFERTLGSHIGHRLQRMHEDNGETFHMGCTLKSVDRGRTGLDVNLSDGTVLHADLVLVGVGVVPEVSAFEGTGLVTDGAIRVDEGFRTGKEGIFAAGDIASFPHPVTGDRARIEHWAVAQRQGIHAARAMMGSDEAFKEELFFWTRQHGTSIMYTGFTRSWDEIAVRGDIDDGDFLAGFAENGRVTAACSMGMGDELIACGALLAAGRNITADEVRDGGHSFVDRLKT